MPMTMRKKLVSTKFCKHISKRVVTSIRESFASIKFRSIMSNALRKLTKQVSDSFLIDEFIANKFNNSSTTPVIDFAFVNRSGLMECFFILFLRIRLRASLKNKRIDFEELYFSASFF